MTALDDQARLMNEHEAAAILGLKPTTLRRWRWAGRGPSFIKIGGAVRYDWADIMALVQSGRRTSTSDAGSVAEDGGGPENHNARTDFPYPPLISVG